MKTKFIFYLLPAVCFSASQPVFSYCFGGESFAPPALSTFEGRIRTSVTQGNQTEDLLYTLGTNFLRVELTATNWPNPADILDRNSGALTLVFPNNGSFTRLKPRAHPETVMPGIPHAPGHNEIATPMPQMPPGVGPQSTPGAASVGGTPGLSMQMPPLSPAAMEKLELRDTNEKTNLLGYACEHYEIKQGGKTMDIWATDQLGPFQPYVRNQAPGTSPRTIEEQWANLLKAKGAFPLLATLKFEYSAEQFRFEVKSVTPQHLTEDDLKLFQPPAGYREIPTLPF